MEFTTMSSDELWALYERVSGKLAHSLVAEVAQLEQRLRKIKSAASDDIVPDQRRPYPKVLPKYRNPKDPAETWSGRGRQPHWVRAQLQSGKKLDDLRIGYVAL
jgi:DNA-binding protein H-NS